MAAIYKAGRIGGAAVYSDGSGSTASTPVGIAIEAQAAQALAGRQIVAVGLAVEWGEAFALSLPGGGAVGVAIDIQSALALQARQIAAVGLAVEAGVALAPASVAATQRRASRSSRTTVRMDGAGRRPRQIQ